jgi:hypothetical protein
MMKKSSLVAALLLTLGTAPSWAQPTPLLVSGQQTIAILDTNMDGMPDEEDDCSFEASLNGANLLIESTLGAGVALQGCTGDYMGTASANGGIGINFTSAPGVVGGVQLPTKATFFSGGGGGGGAGNSVMTLDRATIELEDGTPAEETAGGSICTQGGPAVIVRATDGTTMLFPLELFPSASAPSYLKAPRIPLADSTGEKMFVDGYIPVTPEGKITVMREGATTSIVEIDLADLDPCGGPGVPTMNEFGLIALMLGLLAGGVLVLRRRPAFANALTL